MPRSALVSIVLMMPTLASAFVARSKQARTFCNRGGENPHSSLLTRAAFVEDASGVIDNFFQTQPYMAAFLTCSVKASAADLMAQKQQHQAKLLPPDTSSLLEQDKKDSHAHTIQQDMQPLLNSLSIDQQAQHHHIDGDEEVATILSRRRTKDDNDSTSATIKSSAEEYDVSRNLGFVCYGGLYQGVAQEFMFNNLYPNFFPQLTGWASIYALVAFDMLIVGPFLCLPLAYAVKAMFTRAGSYGGAAAGMATAESARLVTRDLVGRATWSGADAVDGTVVEALLSALGGLGLGSCVAAGLNKYCQDVQEQSLLLKYWGLWFPVQCLTFGVIPPHYRVAFVAAISFFWVFILSSIAASSGTPPAKAQES